MQQCNLFLPETVTLALQSGEPDGCVDNQGEALSWKEQHPCSKRDSYPAIFLSVFEPDNISTVSHISAGQEKNIPENKSCTILQSNVTKMTTVVKQRNTATLLS